MEILCGQCGAALTGNKSQRFCVRCGTELSKDQLPTDELDPGVAENFHDQTAETLSCVFCGNKLSGNDKKCSNCKRSRDSIIASIGKCVTCGSPSAKIEAGVCKACGTVQPTAEVAK